MRSVGAPIGNKNAARGKEWLRSLKRAIASEAGEGSFRKGLDKCAIQLVKAVLAGESWALQELGNRIDGKPGLEIQDVGDGQLTLMEGRIRLIPVMVDAAPQQLPAIEHNTVVDEQQTVDKL